LNTDETTPFMDIQRREGTKFGHSARTHQSIISHSWATKSTNNIPGVPGVAKKRAFALLQGLGSIKDYTPR